MRPLGRKRFPSLYKGGSDTFGFNLARALGSETVSSVDEWSCCPSGGVSFSGQSNTATQVTATFTGSIPGEYLIKCKFTKSGGGTRNATAKIKILDTCEEEI